MKQKKIKPYGRTYNKLAIEVAFEFAPEIKPCKDCGRPVPKIYCCRWCGSTDP